jgi:hypothetical protein
LKKCCKLPENWINNGTKDKDVQDLGKAVNITSKTYITCKECENRMFIHADKKLVDVVQ